jgi:4,5-dihydroxyphthalate decarboxylase
MNGTIPVRFACGLYDRMLPLFTGQVRPEGVDLDFQVMDDPRAIFDRMSGGQEFDCAELSASEFITQVAAGDCPFVALPVFPSRMFRHGMISVNRRAGISGPKDLAGKRIGVPLYTMTAAVFIRGLLESDYGVDLSGVTWVQGAINRAGSHGNPTVRPMHRPARIEINTSGRTLSDLIAAGEIDAIIGTSLPDALRTDPDVQRLFPDFRRLEQDYYRRTKIFPIMHLVALRRELHEAHPGLAGSLYQAFNASKAAALAQMRYTGALRYMLPWMVAEIEDNDGIFGADPWPYGVGPNRPTLEALMSYMVAQGLIARPIDVDKLFVAVPD